MNSKKIDQIKAAFARDQQEDRPAVEPGDIPWRYEAITPEWMTHILCRDHPAAQIVSISLDEPDSGTSNRRRIFVEYDADGQAAGLPSSVFCKATVDLRNRLLLSTSALLSETTFYNQIRPQLSIEAPESYLAVYDPESYASIVMLKDLGDTVSFCNHHTRMTLERVQDQMRLLATLHGHFYRSPQLDDGLAHMFRYDDRFLALDRDHDFKGMCEAGLREAADVAPGRLMARQSEVWSATLRASARHGALPPTITHGDVHLKNWYITADGRMGLSDWQVTSKGHWSRDVAYTISTALTIDQRRLWEKDLLRYYLEAFAASGGEAISFDEAWLNYRQQLLTTLAWWTMTLTPLGDVPDMQARDITVEFIRRIATAIDDLDALDSLD
ncbi:phosphotransferase [Sphingobium sp.]|uniref:phosphotransferase n=1 Tax=Sphingobium sp. TaxID=1912891 RepID=UPI002B960F86|nr:phosphotransferase [Sphingobium sp.]HUD95220.1 phosphotransferase [Sphingobium sp.]